MDFTIEKVRRSEHSIYLNHNGKDLHLVIDDRSAVTLYSDGEMRINKAALSDAGINVKIDENIREKKKKESTGIKIDNLFEFEAELGRMSKKERDKVIAKTLRKLFHVEYDPELDKGEIHGEKEQKFLRIIDTLLDTDYNCFDDFAGHLIYHLREEKCMD